MGRDIADHMTPEEQSRARRHAAWYGTWGGITFAGPLSIAMTFRTPGVIAAASLLMLLHLIGIPVFLGMQRRLLSSTAWVRVQGISPDDVRLFTFRQED